MHRPVGVPPGVACWGVPGWEKRDLPVPSMNGEAPQLKSASVGVGTFDSTLARNASCCGGMAGTGADPDGSSLLGGAVLPASPDLREPISNRDGGCLDAHIAAKYGNSLKKFLFLEALFAATLQSQTTSSSPNELARLTRHAFSCASYCLASTPSPHESQSMIVSCCGCGCGFGRLGAMNAARVCCTEEREDADWPG